MRGRLRDWWPLAAIAVIVAAAFYLLYVVWRSPHRSDLATYGAFAVAIVALAAGWIGWAWRRARTSPAALTPVGEDLDHVADLLAVAVQKQWTVAAGERGLTGTDPIAVSWGRPSLPLAGPPAAAAESQRFAPLPGLALAGEAQLASGQVSDLHAVYGGLGSGRLVIAGAAGSGKSGAAVLLVLAALKHREQLSSQDRPKVPVPVLFTVQDWDPRRQPVADWLTVRLQETYQLFTGAAGLANAAGLIAAGKIAMILDGLDEIPEELRPIALQALNQQASFRVVVLSRTAEMASAASRHGVLEGAAAIELRAIDPRAAASYLERVQRDPPPDGWRDLIKRIRSSPGNPLSNALDSPLTLTLIRDTYQSGDDARELLDFCDTIHPEMHDGHAAEEIIGYLLDRVLPAAYAHRPGQPPPPYDLPTAQNALARIAARMNQDGNRDLQWWRIHKWASSAQRLITVGLAAGLVFGLVDGLLLGLVSGLESGLVSGLVFGPMFGLTVGLASTGGDDPPRRIGRLRLRLRLTWSVLGLVLVEGLGLGLVIGLVFGLTVGLKVGLVVGLAAGLGGAFMGVLGPALEAGFADPDTTSSLSPAVSWRSDRRYASTVGLAAGLGIGIPIGLGAGILVGLRTGLGTGLQTGLETGLGTGLVVGILGGILSAQVWPSSLAAAQLAARWHTPMHLLRFLDDAHERNVLRTLGPVYQFRHARLQDRLATSMPEMTTTPAAHRLANVPPASANYEQ